MRLITITHDYYGMSERDVELARQISAVARELGAHAEPSAVQNVLVTIDALDGTKVMPFWPRTVDLVPGDGRAAPTAQPDPRRRLGAYDQAEARITAAIAAGGHLVTDQHAPAWWVLADAEGNEACVATVVGRD